MNDDNDGIRPGWRLHLVCAVCGAEALHSGFVITQAADAATREGWTVDYDHLHASARDRIDVCPKHEPDGSTRQ